MTSIPDSNRWQFQPRYSTEAALRIVATDDELFDVLTSLVTNVVLLAEEDDTSCARLHPRIDMAKTSSFAELPAPWKASLVVLYNDYFYVRQEGA
jgi:hypothetical protein